MYIWNLNEITHSERRPFIVVLVPAWPNVTNRDSPLWGRSFTSQVSLQSRITQRR